MHRHGYKGRKFGRETDQRRALMRSLADSLVLHEKIETTVTKAKEIVPYIEKLITKAKKGDLHSRRQVIASLMTVEAAHKLVDELAPKLTSRNSGHVRLERTTTRRGDNAQLATVSFVEFDKVAPTKAEVTAKNTTETPKDSVTAKPKAKKAAEKKAPVKKAVKKPALATKPKEKK